MNIIDVVFVYHLVEHERVAWHGRYHSHARDEYEIHFFLDGSGFFLCGNVRHRIAAEKFFITGQGEFHSIIPDLNGRPISYYAILFNCKDGDIELRNLLSEIFEKNANEVSISSTNRLQCEDILKLFLSQDGALKKSAEYALLSLLFRVYREHGLFCVPPCECGNQNILTKNTSAHLHVTRALHVMQKNVRSNLGVDEIARILAISTEHLIRVFRNEIKLTPYQYMLRLKIEGASGLLISTTKPIGEIADWFGFDNQFHFSRCFKRCTGISPIEFRKTYLQTADF